MNWIDHLPAAQANSLNQQFQNDWNQAAADQWSASRQALRDEPDADPYEGLYHKYSPFQQTELGEESRDRAARMFAASITGNAPLGMAGRGLLHDPTFRHVYQRNPKVAGLIWERVYGNSMDDDVRADQIRQQQNLPSVTATQLAAFSAASQPSAVAARNKIAMQQVKLMEDQVGLPFTQWKYDPQKQAVTNRMRKDELGNMVPDEPLNLPMEAYDSVARAMQTLLPTGGFKTFEDLLMEREELKRKEAADNARRAASAARIAPNRQLLEEQQRMFDTIGGINMGGPMQYSDEPPSYIPPHFF